MLNVQLNIGKHALIIPLKYEIHFTRTRFWAISRRTVLGKVD
jgi:hypothetical protein